MFNRYFLEIKNRIFLLVASWLLTVITCYYYKNILLFLLIKSNFKLYNLEVFYFIATNLSDVFSVCLQISYFLSTQFLIFLVIYHFLMFLAPGLFKFEYTVLQLFCFICLFFYIIGVTVLHCIILPFMWEFFTTFQLHFNLNVFFEAKITEYFIFYKDIYLLTVLISQVFSFVLLNLVLINQKLIFITKSRKSIYLVFILIATLLTPPDVFTQFIFGVNFVIFYELIVLHIFFVKYFV